MSARALEVIATGPLATVQDLGRPGYAHLGVPRSGAADRGSLATANRLVGNTADAAGIEVTLGGLVVIARGDVYVATAGARCEIAVDGVAMGRLVAHHVRSGQTLTIGTATEGLRCYLAVRGGVDVAPVLGSRSTDTLSALGPPPLREGTLLPIGTAAAQWPTETTAFADLTGHAAAVPVTLYASPGPRADLAERPDALFDLEWVVSESSDRVGIRLDRADPAAPGPRARVSVASEGVALGSVQLPPGGQPVLFLADHPVTGGYPVIAVIDAESLDRAAQLPPGDHVRLVRS